MLYLRNLVNSTRNSNKEKKELNEPHYHGDRPEEEHEEQTGEITTKRREKIDEIFKY